MAAVAILNVGTCKLKVIIFREGLGPRRKLWQTEQQGTETIANKGAPHFDFFLHFLIVWNPDLTLLCGSWHKLTFIPSAAL